MNILERIEQEFRRTPQPDEATVKLAEKQRRAESLERYRALIAEAHAAEIVPDETVDELVRLLLDMDLCLLHLKEHWAILDKEYSPGHIRLYPDDWVPTGKPGKGVAPELYHFIQDEWETQRMKRIADGEAQLNTLREKLAAAVTAPVVDDVEIESLVVLAISLKKTPDEMERAIAALSRGVPPEAIWVDNVGVRIGIPQ
jgi:hypothetical protein